MEKALAYIDTLSFDTACDRSVQGSMRTAKMQDLDGMLLRVRDVMDLPINSVSARLNERPIRIKGMKASECLWPARAMQEFIATLL